MFSDVEAMLHREIDKLTAERDTLQNEVYDLKHVIQHWEVDCDGLKDELETERMRLAACGVAAGGAGDEQFKDMLPEYDSKALRSTRELVRDNERLQAANDIIDDTIGKLTAENERLRAEHEFLDAQYSACQRFHTNITQLMADNKQLAADNERLRERLNYSKAAHDAATRLLESSRLDNERLRAELATQGRLHEEWRNAAEMSGKTVSIRERELTELREAAEAVKVRHEIETLVTPEAMRFCAVLAKVKP